MTDSEISRLIEWQEERIKEARRLATIVAFVPLVGVLAAVAAFFIARALH